VERREAWRPPSLGARAFERRRDELVGRLAALRHPSGFRGGKERPATPAPEQTTGAAKCWLAEDLQVCSKNLERRIAGHRSRDTARVPPSPLWGGSASGASRGGVLADEERVQAELPSKEPHPDRLRCAQPVDPPHKGEGEEGEALPDKFSMWDKQCFKRLPLTRLGASRLATLSPLRGAREKAPRVERNAQLSRAPSDPARERAAPQHSPVDLR
jgi:hypothetical protein